VPDKPIDVPTRATVGFITAHVRPGASVLEIGCGAGDVALELTRRGYHVTAIDSDADAVNLAGQRGVHATLASWPGFTCPPVDAVVFTRSLHHISPLDDAIARARETLRPTGVLLVEDFAFDAADAATVGWFVGVLRSTVARSIVVPHSDGFVSALLSNPDPMVEWRANHDHDLHTATAMSAAVARHFTIIEARSVPYAFRYLVPVLPETAEAMACIETVLAEETRRGTAGAIRLIGRRIAASDTLRPR
jgi:cyclopropane fatty-acyl-phospholipid synthase-like methyltransferase